MALHHVFLQLIIVGDEENVLAVRKELKEMKVSSLGIDVDALWLQASNDNLSGNYLSLQKHADLFDTQQSIKDLVGLLNTL